MEETAASILLAMGKAYRSFESYSDTGCMEEFWDPDTDDARVTALRFSTHFKRPNFFRFEWRNYSDCSELPDDVNVIWSDGKKSYRKYRYDEKPKRDSDLSMAVAGATGVSSGTAHSISSLLIEDVGGFTLTNLENPTCTGSGFIGDEECHQIHSVKRNNDIWISKQRSIILRIDEDYTIETQKHTGVTELRPIKPLHIINKTIYRDVTINSFIPNGMFSLNGLDR